MTLSTEDAYIEAMRALGTWVRNLADSSPEQSDPVREHIRAALDAIIDRALGRDLTDDEATQFEALERALELGRSADDHLPLVVLCGCDSAADELAWLAGLVDEGACSPECLFAGGDARDCTCRCRGGHHGDARWWRRRDLPVQIPPTMDEILEALKAIIEAAEGRDLTDEEAERYEQLETDLAVARRSVEIRSRQARPERSWQLRFDGSDLGS